MVDTKLERFEKGAKAVIAFHEKYLETVYNAKYQSFNNDLAIWEEKYMYSQTIIEKESINIIKLSDTEIGVDEFQFYVAIYSNSGHSVSVFFDKEVQAKKFKHQLTNWRFDQQDSLD